MPQQSQRPPRVTDLQPWQTDAPLEDQPTCPGGGGWSATGAADFRGKGVETCLGCTPTFLKFSL